MKTRYRIIPPHGETTLALCDLPAEPGYQRLVELIEPHLDGAMLERLSVLADFEGGTDYQRLDMFVDDSGLIKRLPRNERATAIYRNAALQLHPQRDPESISWIAGPAILFDRRVWF